MKKENRVKQNVLKRLRAKLEGKVLRTHEQRHKELSDDQLKVVAGGMMGLTDSCCPCADDCQD